MKRLASAALFALLLASAAPTWAAPTPISIHPVEGMAAPTPPAVTAQGWILYDDTYQLVLASQDPDIERPLASTTKIMTALVALELGDLDGAVTVSDRAAAVGESEIGLVAGEQIPLIDLITVLMVRSANDAAMAVAEAVGGSVEGFVAMMNGKAAAMGLEHTQFANPHGLDDPGQFSSPSNLLAIARAAMDHPVLAEMVRTRVYRMQPAPDGTPRIGTSTNRLLDTYSGAIGIKTGFTLQSGLVLVAAAERDGRRLYTVVMGSEGEDAHFSDAAALLDYGFDRYRLIALIADGERYGILKAGTEEATIVAAGEASALLPDTEAVEITASTDPATGAPVLVGEGQIVATEPIALSPLPGPASALGWIETYVDWFRGLR